MQVKTPRLLPALITAALFIAISIHALNSTTLNQPIGALGETVTRDISNALFTGYVAPFIITGILLVAALVAGVYLAKQGPQRRWELYEAIETKPRFDGDTDEGGDSDGSS